MCKPQRREWQLHHPWIIIFKKMIHISLCHVKATSITMDLFVHSCLLWVWQFSPRWPIRALQVTCSLQQIVLAQFTVRTWHLNSNTEVVFIYNISKSFSSVCMSHFKESDSQKPPDICGYNLTWTSVSLCWFLHRLRKYISCWNLWSDRCQLTLGEVSLGKRTGKFVLDGHSRQMTLMKKGN